jgi:hypothetical protein
MPGGAVGHRSVIPGTAAAISVENPAIVRLAGPNGRSVRTTCSPMGTRARLMATQHFDPTADSNTSRIVCTAGGMTGCSVLSCCSQRARRPLWALPSVGVGVKLCGGKVAAVVVGGGVPGTGVTTIGVSCPLPELFPPPRHPSLQPCRARPQSATANVSGSRICPVLAREYAILR